MRLIIGLLILVLPLSTVVANVAPTDINIDASDVDENQAIGTLIGNLTTTDADVLDVHSYSFVAGAGDTDNALFSIVGDQLQTNAVFDFETQNTYSVRIQTDDGNGGTFEEAFTININDVNENPVVDPAVFAIDEHIANGSTVGFVTSSDVDGDDVSYSISAGNVGSAFSINPGTGQITVNNYLSVDFEVTPVFSLTILGTDDGTGNLTDTEIITINLSNVNDAPILTVPGVQSVLEDADLTINGVSIADQDVGAGDINITMSVADGYFTLNSIVGLSFTVGDGTADVAMTFSGTLANVNTALNGLVYHSDDDFVGNDILNISIDDDGNTGPGGVLSDSDFVTIQVNARPVVYSTHPVSQTICDEESVMFFIEHNADATPPVAYQWLFNGVPIAGETNDTLTLTGLSAANSGNYSCRATNLAGVVNSNNGFLTMRRKPVADFDYTQVCFGNETDFTNLSSISAGSITDYSWDLGDGSNSITADTSYEYLTSGDFNIQLIVESNFGCLDTLDSTITVFHVPVIDVDIENVCFESPFITENNTSIAGGSMTHAWNFNDGNTSNNAIPNHYFQSTGTYNVSYIVTSDNGCVRSTSNTIVVDPKPISNFVVYDGCDSTDIPINGVASISTGTLEYYWDFGDGTADTGVMNPVHMYVGDSTYYIELIVESDKGCWDTLVKPLEIYPRPDLDLTVNQPKCDGNDGIITVLGSNSTDPYFYSWDEGIYSTANFRIVPEGDSTLISVKDFNGCIRAQWVYIDDPTPVQISGITVTDPTCAGISNGEVSFEASGGTPSYSYAIHNYEVPLPPALQITSFPQFSALPEDVYEIVVKDNFQCKTFAMITIEAPDTIAINVSATHLDCKGDDDGEILAQASGGVGTFQYSFDGGNTYGSDSLADNLIAGFYVLAVLDENGCSKSYGVNLEEPEESVSVSISQQNDVLCHGYDHGNVEVEGDGGTGLYYYSLDNQSYSQNQTIDSLAAGNYTVYVLDQNDCLDSLAIVISEPLSFVQVDSVNVVEPNCFGDLTAEMIVYSSGGTPNYEYNFMNNGWTSNSLYEGLGGGWNSFTIKDNNGCELLDSIFVQEPDVLDVNILNQENEICEQDYLAELSLEATGGTSPYTFTMDGISNNDGEFSSLTSGDYLYTVEDVNGCLYTNEISFVPEFNLPDAGFTMFSSGGAVNFENNTEDGVEYVWSFGDGTTSTQEAPFHFYPNIGIYPVELIAVNSCGTDTVVQNFVYGVNSLDGKENVVVDYQITENYIQLLKVEISNFILIDINGKEINTSLDDSQSIFIGGLSTGVYLLRVQGEFGTSVIKFVKI